MPVTAFYASILALVFVALAFRVIQTRRSEKVAVGDGGNTILMRRMRVHGNFAEYAPLALLLIALAESLRADVRIVHALGLALVAGRCLHAWGMSQTKENFRFRAAGMITTFIVIIAAALLCFFGSLWHGTVF